MILKGDLYPEACNFGAYRGMKNIDNNARAYTYRNEITMCLLSGMLTPAIRAIDLLRLLFHFNLDAVCVEALHYK